MSARQPRNLPTNIEPATEIARLIPVGTSAIGGGIVQTTSARDLHVFLKVGKDFSTWAKAQIARARLVKERDYVCSPSRGSTGQRTIEYHLTLEAGKHVAMMSETDKGFEVREYFIECERRTHATPTRPAELSRMDLIEMAMAAERERIAADAKVHQLEHKLADQAPAVAGLNLISDASGSLCFRDAAATLKMRQCDLTDYLVSKGWIYEREGVEGYKAYRARLQSLDLRYNTFGYESKTTGERKARQQVRITNKGLARLATMIAGEATTKRMAADAGQHQQRLPLPGNDG